MKDDKKLEKQADTFTDDDMDNVTGRMVNEVESISAELRLKKSKYFSEWRSLNIFP
jgi:hypothetical protein